MLMIAMLTLCAALSISGADGQATLPGPSALSRVPGAGTLQPPSLQSNANSASGAIIVDDNYRLGTGGKMKIAVYGEEDLTGEFLVNGAGEVQFPLLGQVKAAGLSVHEFVAELTALLGAKYLRDPRVSVEIENYRPFYIMGEVNKPGEYPFENGLNVLGAVALAGGYTYRADDKDVRIRRNGSDKEETLPANANTKINPGDVIEVAERIF